MAILVNAAIDAKFKFDREALEIVFLDLPRQSFNLLRNVTIESQIIDTVLIPRVLKDCNLVGGEILRIDLRKTNISLEDQGVVIHVPKHVINNRKIMSVHGVTMSDDFVYRHRDEYIYEQGNSLGRDFDIDGINLAFTRSRLIGNNTILVEGITQINFLPNIIIELMVTNSNRLGNIDGAYYSVFSEMANHAVGSYIYLMLRRAVNQYSIKGGSTYDGIKEIISELGDEEEKYVDMRDNVWPKVSRLSDTESYNRQIRLSVGNL